jgi:hypothetical protein
MTTNTAQAVPTLSAAQRRVLGEIAHNRCIRQNLSPWHYVRPAARAARGTTLPTRTVERLLEMRLIDLDRDAKQGRFYFPLVVTNAGRAILTTLEGLTPP